MPSLPLMLLSRFAAPATSPAALPTPVWPLAFSASFVESTWYKGGMQQYEGGVVYDWERKGQVINRKVSMLNPICNEARPNRTTPCVHHLVGDSRYLIWPGDGGECCLDCNQSCGVIKPSWVNAVPSSYIGLRNFNNVTCNEWYLNSDTPDRLATTVDKGELCELYDGGADFTGDNPFQWSILPSTYRHSVDPSDLVLPPQCVHAARCTPTTP
eukprot:Hpha_TRINITY_DN31131_c0_g1::TRINITY_DN31131_c0_g1_i1::g.32963::m.32963